MTEHPGGPFWRMTDAEREAAGWVRMHAPKLGIHDNWIRKDLSADCYSENDGTDAWNAGTVKRTDDGIRFATRVRVECDYNDQNIYGQLRAHVRHADGPVSVDSPVLVWDSGDEAEYFGEVAAIDGGGRMKLNVDWGHRGSEARERFVTSQNQPEVADAPRD